MEQVLFFVFAAQAVLAAVLSVTRKNTVAAACWLVLMFFALAGVYALMEAWFVAAIQILVYAGAIMVLFLFVIMLMDLRSTELAAHKGPKMRVLGLLLSFAFLAIVVYAIHDAGKRPGAVADRVTAVLHLPTPPPKPSEDPTQPDVETAAPPPHVVPLTRVAQVPSSWKFTPKDRSSATLYEGVAIVAGRESRFTIGVGSGALYAGGDGTVGDLTRGSVRIPLPDGPAGAEVEVTLQQGGLSAYAGGGPDGSARAMGKGLFEEWLLPFEIVSLLLTGAIFGTVVLTKRRLS